MILLFLPLPLTADLLSMTLLSPSVFYGFSSSSSPSSYSHLFFSREIYSLILKFNEAAFAFAYS